jgi:hypothetical protein
MLHAPHFLRLSCVDGFFRFGLCGGNQLHILLLKLFVQRVGVIGFIIDQAFRHVVNEPFGQSFADKSDFMQRNIHCVDGERKTNAVCHHYVLRTFAPLGLSDFAALFSRR